MSKVWLISFSLLSLTSDKVLELLSPFVAVLPEVRKPERKVSQWHWLNETLSLVCVQVYLRMCSVDRSSPPLTWAVNYMLKHVPV